MDKIYSFIFIFGFCYFVNAMMNIRQLNVPNAEVGKNATLDCIFEADEEIELRWYHNNRTVYRWTPGTLPRSMGAFQDRIDTSFKASDDEKTMYRALRLIDVKSPMAGNYTCELSGRRFSASSTKPLNLYSSIHIIDLKVPDSVELREGKDVILDCEYVQGDKDLEIKWFFKDDINLVYQWIPGQQPQALGPMKSYIDTNYRVSNDKNSMYRALHLINLSTDLSGNYTCKVSGFNSEDQATKAMVVYKPAKSGIELIHNDTQQSIVCSANGVYPLPDMNLFVSSEDKETVYLEDTDDSDDIILQGDESYNITKELDYRSVDLPSAAVIVCRLRIPGTSYIIEKTQPYLHGHASSSCNPIYIFFNDTLEIMPSGGTNSCTTSLEDNSAHCISISGFLILVTLLVTMEHQFSTNFVL